MDEIYMQRCISLASKGIGNVAPNPMVGSVVVCEGKIIGEGYHVVYGKSHAEVNAINSVKDKSLLSKSTLYVSLEPCSHFGKTPPCADFIIQNKIPKVVVGCRDNNSSIAIKGIEKLKEAGVEVTYGILEEECKKLNKRFFTFHEQKRPYIILKWAQTLDNYIDILRNPNNERSPIWISSEETQILTHKWRTEEQAIIVGTNTAKNDNPKLTSREWKGKNPLRIVIDEHLEIPQDSHLYDQSAPTIFISRHFKESKLNIEYLEMDFSKDIVQQIIQILYQREIQSLVVEGGKYLIESFMKHNLWDEARVLVGNKIFEHGVMSPHLCGNIIENTQIDNDRLVVFENNKKNCNA